MTTTARAGQMLASAIYYGALLDPAWWDSWFEAAIRKPVLVDDLVWLDIQPLDPKSEGRFSQPRRWFADPVTRMLLAHWHSKSAAAVTRNAQDCLRDFLSCPGDTPDLLVSLLAHAERRWQLRMPSVLVAHAAGRHRAVPVEPEDWLRVLGRKFERQAAVPRAKPAPRTIQTWCIPARQVLEKYPAPKDGLGRLRAKNNAVDDLRKLRASSPAERLMHAWCLDALTCYRGKQTQRGILPMTVKGHLENLTKLVIDASDDLLKMTAEEIEDRFDARLEMIESDGKRNKTLNAARSLYHYLRRCRPELPPFPRQLNEHATEQRVSADLISPVEFARALGYANADQQICLILGFRCGLRYGEVKGLRAQDFLVGEQVFELTVIRNEHRELKNATTRRVLPLHLLLDPGETKILKKRVKERVAALGIADGQNLIVDDAVVGMSGDGSVGAETALNLILNEAAFGSDSLVSSEKLPAEAGHDNVKKIPPEKSTTTTLRSVRYHHLRHSFGTYLLTTMLLPDDFRDAPIPTQLRSVISFSRKDRIVESVLGKQKLGQHSLHAISVLLGHIVPETTIRSYSHLLDLSILHYVSRRVAGPALSKRQLRQLTLRQSNVAPTILESNETELSQSRRPRSYRAPLASDAPLNEPAVVSKVSDWRGRRVARRERYFASPEAGKIKVKRPREKKSDRLKYPDWRHIAAVLIPSIDPTKETAFPASIETWTQAASSIFDLRTVEGKVRHERDLGVIQKSSKLRNYVDSRWRADRQLTSLERRALFYAIEHWDRSRAQVRFESRPLAVAWRDLLIDIGFEKAELEITVVAAWFRKRSSHELHQMLPETDNLPGTARRRGKRGRIRIAFKGYGETARQVRAAGHFVMLLLAIREGYGNARRRRQ